MTRHYFYLSVAVFAAVSASLPQTSTLGDWASAFTTFAALYWGYKAGNSK